MPNPPQIEDGAALDAALSSDAFLLFKHSFRCPVSGRAFDRYAGWFGDDPGIDSGWIDVVASRDLSLLVAERTGVTHQSPQAILLRAGKAVWNESHHGITEVSLDTAVGTHT